MAPNDSRAAGQWPFVGQNLQISPPAAAAAAAAAYLCASMSPAAGPTGGGAHCARNARAEKCENAPRARATLRLSPLLALLQRRAVHAFERARSAHKERPARRQQAQRRACQPAAPRQRSSKASPPFPIASRQPTLAAYFCRAGREAARWIAFRSVSIRFDSIRFVSFRFAEPFPPPCLWLRSPARPLARSLSFAPPGSSWPKRPAG